MRVLQVHNNKPHQFTDLICGQSQSGSFVHSLGHTVGQIHDSLIYVLDLFALPPRATCGTTTMGNADI